MLNLMYERHLIEIVYNLLKSGWLGNKWKVIGCSKFINNSNPIIFFDEEQLTYFNPLVSKKLLAV